MNGLIKASSPAFLLRPAKQLARPFISILCLSLTVISYSAWSATDEVGEIEINGEVIPPELFDYYFGREVRSLTLCAPTARKEKIIDMIVAAKQLEIDTGVGIGKNRTILENYETSLSNLEAPETRKKTKEVVEELQRQRGRFLQFRDFDVTRKDLYDEYHIRVRDKDPHITDVTIVRVLEIKRPSGSGWDEQLIELATDIKQGKSFEEAATRYPSRYTVNHQSDRWVALDALPHNIDKNTVKAGDVYGVEKILRGEEYYDPMLKIYEVKVLSQVRLSDVIYSEKSLHFYLSLYLNDKAKERKEHLFMSQLWTNFAITEDGNPIQRVGFYPPCEKF
ncbi:hypothetical protein N9383_01965 [Granulosicoccus sp.]|nr:hypothetical protein [Granulosicoccus sp.]